MDIMSQKQLLIDKKITALKNKKKMINNCEEKFDEYKNTINRYR